MGTAARITNHALAGTGKRGRGNGKGELQFIPTSQQHHDITTSQKNKKNG